MDVVLRVEWCWGRRGTLGQGLGYGRWMRGKGSVLKVVDVWIGGATSGPVVRWSSAWTAGVAADQLLVSGAGVYGPMMGVRKRDAK